MMEITDRTIQAEIVGFVGAFSLACIVVGQTNLAGYAIMALAGALSMAKVADKQAETEPTQAVEDTASDLSPEDLVPEIDNKASLVDTTTLPVTELSDADILNKAAAIIAAQNGNTETIVTQ